MKGKGIANEDMKCSRKVEQKDQTWKQRKGNNKREEGRKKSTDESVSEYFSVSCLRLRDSGKSFRQRGS